MRENRACRDKTEQRFRMIYRSTRTSWLIHYGMGWSFGNILPWHWRLELVSQYFVLRIAIHSHLNVIWYMTFALLRCVCILPLCWLDHFTFSQTPLFLGWRFYYWYSFLLVKFLLQRFHSMKMYSTFLFFNWKNQMDWFYWNSFSISFLICFFFKVYLLTIFFRGTL